MSVDVVLDELADLVQEAARVVGGGTAGAVVQLVGLALRTGSGTVRILDAVELERIRRSRLGL